MKIISVALLSILFVFILCACGNNIPNTEATNTDDTKTGKSLETTAKEELSNYIDKAKQLLNKQNFNEALATLDTAEQIYGQDSRIDEMRTTVNVEKLLNEVSQYEEKEDYLGAIKYIQNSSSTVTEDTRVMQKLNVLKNQYKDIALKQAEKLSDNSDYEAAIAVLEESQKVLDDKDISDAIKRYKDYLPINIADLDYFSGHDFTVDNNVRDNLGNTHNNVTSPSGENAWANKVTTNIYKINKEYSKLTGLWFQLYDFRTEIVGGISATNYYTELEIYGDNKVLYSGNMQAGYEPKEIDIDISGVSELKIHYFVGVSDGSYSGIPDFNLHK